MKVLGLDPSMTATGVALPDGTTRTWRMAAPLGDVRLALLQDELNQVLDEHQVDLAVIEDLPTHSHGAGITGMAQGVLRAVLVHRVVPYATVPPATLKKFATNRGNANKSEMILAAFKRSGIEFGDDNQCDAAWLRWAGQHHHGATGRPDFSMPATHREALSRVTWPELGVAAGVTR